MSETAERVARALATKHYMERFRKVADDPHIVLNVDRNWQIFIEDARVATAVVVAECVEAVENTHWRAPEDETVQETIRGKLYALLPALEPAAE